MPSLPLRTRAFCLGAALVAVAWMRPGATLAQTAADLELVIAVDVSLSMDLDEQRLQRDGYVAAFRDPEVHKVITSGPHGRVAVTYIHLVTAEAPEAPRFRDMVVFRDYAEVAADIKTRRFE